MRASLIDISELSTSLRLQLALIGPVAGSDNGIPVCGGDELFPGEPGECKWCDNVTRGVLKPPEITHRH